MEKVVADCWIMVGPALDVHAAGVAARGFSVDAGVGLGNSLGKCLVPPETLRLVPILMASQPLPSDLEVALDSLPSILVTVMLAGRAVAVAVAVAVGVPLLSSSCSDSLILAPKLKRPILGAGGSKEVTLDGLGSGAAPATVWVSWTWGVRNWVVGA